MAENMMCENHKATNDKFRKEYERIFKKPKREKDEKR